jgi:hypothetical protein
VSFDSENPRSGPQTSLRSQWIVDLCVGLQSGPSVNHPPRPLTATGGSVSDAPSGFVGDGPAFASPASSDGVASLWSDAGVVDQQWGHISPRQLWPTQSLERNRIGDFGRCTGGLEVFVAHSGDRVHALGGVRGQRSAHMSGGTRPGSFDC